MFVVGALEHHYVRSERFALGFHALPCSSASQVILAVTERGGHLGWMRGWRGRSWMMEVVSWRYLGVAAMMMQLA